MTTTNDLLSPETISKIERLRGRDPDIDGLLRHSAALQAQLDRFNEQFELVDDPEHSAMADVIAGVAIEQFRQRAIRAIQTRWLTGAETWEIVELLQQLSTTTEDGE